MKGRVREGKENVGAHAHVYTYIRVFDGRHCSPSRTHGHTNMRINNLELSNGPTHRLNVTRA